MFYFSIYLYYSTKSTRTQNIRARLIGVMNMMIKTIITKTVRTKTHRTQTTRTKTIKKWALPPLFKLLVRTHARSPLEQPFGWPVIEADVNVTLLGIEPTFSIVLQVSASTPRSTPPSPPWPPWTPMPTPMISTTVCRMSPFSDKGS